MDDHDANKLEIQYLEGGRFQQISLLNGCVHRPSGSWTPGVQNLLRHIREQNFYGAPLALGVDTYGNELVSFIEGTVYPNLLNKGISSLEVLISAAQLLKSYHDVSQSFVSEASKYTWQLPNRYPQEVICHGDFAPYNVVINQKKAIGIIDFDTAHPGPRLWDIAYALYRWAPFTNAQNPETYGSLQKQVFRANVFCKAYGLLPNDRHNLMDMIVERLHTLINFINDQADAGNIVCQQNLQAGHHLIYSDDIEYIKLHKSIIEKELTQAIG